jgi:hypothetical protein
MKPTQRLGAAILVGVLLISLANLTLADNGSSPGPSPVPEILQVHGHVGNLKVPFFNNPDVKRILHDRYGLELTVEGMATNDMLCPSDPADLDDVDFLFAGDQSQIATYEACQKRHDPWKNVFLSPMVIYSWASTIDALQQAGVARQDDSGVYFVDMPSLLALMESPKTWNDLGFDHRPSQINTYATDPEESNSGGSFAGLLANTMNCLEVVDSSTVASALSGINAYFQGLGYLETASKSLFDSYMTLGEGARPLVALYESQIADYLYEYAQTHTPEEYQQQRQQVAQDVRMLYPEPTVWTTHPVIARTEAGERVMAALLDRELQQLGWSVTGFRPAVSGVNIDIATSPVTGILPAITSVIDTPGDDVLAQIKQAAKHDPGPGTPRRNCSSVIPEVSPSPA